MKILVLISLVMSFLFASVDINSADAKELATLNGIGEKKAGAIVEFRKEHCFKSVDEIVKIKGIGSKILEKNRDNLAVGECK